jgi:hypothetical protein
VVRRATVCAPRRRGISNLRAGSGTPLTAIFENSSHMAFVEERERYMRVAGDFLARVEARSG